MTHKEGELYDGSVSFEYFGDDNFAHYILPGERFKYRDEILNLTLQYNGACMVDPQKYAEAVQQCDFNCEKCAKSIYHQIGLRKRFFDSRCVDICKRVPKVGDEWEVSIYTESDHPRYENFFFRAIAARPQELEEASIIELALKSMMEFRPTFLQIAKYCYVKIRRVDLEKPLDVSTIANQMFRQMMEPVYPVD